MTDNVRNRFGLTQRDMQTFREIFDKYPDVKEVHIFGSRAKGNFKNGSDVDLAIVNKDFNSSTLAKLSGEFEDSALPYRIDLVVLSDLTHADLIDHINRVGIIFFKN